MWDSSHGNGLNLADWPPPQGAALLDGYYLLTIGTTLLVRLIMLNLGKLRQKI
jgi:hypothetical protein